MAFAQQNIMNTVLQRSPGMPMAWVKLALTGIWLASASGFSLGQAWATPPLTQPAPEANYIPGELLVKFKPAYATSAETVHAAANSRRKAGMKRWERVQLPQGLSVAAAVKWYGLRPEVEYAEPNYRVRKATLPNDISFSLQWGLSNTGQAVNGAAGLSGADISATRAWRTHTGSRQVVVAVIDTGIDYLHPDLQANIWQNPKESVNGNDDDGNGKIDDVRGWNFVANSADPVDDDIDGHGTHVAGIIGAVGDNGTGISGVSWQVSLMPLKVLDANGDGSLAHIVAAIDYAIDAGAHIINASYAFRCGAAASNAEREALERARSAGLLVVAAAGNDGCNNDQQPTYPASHALNHMLSVGATDSTDSRAFFKSGSSSYGAHTVHLFAPGKHIYSTVRQVLSGGYAFESGTSMASPHVSGAAALVKAANPALSMREVREVLLLSVTELQALNSRAVTSGRLNVGQAIAMNLASHPPVRPSHLRLSAISDDRIKLQWLDDSTTETHWLVQHRTSPSRAFEVVASVASSDNPGHEHNGLQLGEGSYHGYRVVAVNNQGESAPTAEVVRTVVPHAPANLTVTAQPARMNLVWQDRSNRETGYRVERATGNTGAFTELAVLAPDSQSYADTQVQANLLYRYRVRAEVENTVFSDYSAVQSATALPPDEPATTFPPTSGNGGGGCFIATAAWGSELHPKVMTLRAFRDQVLMNHAWGQRLVSTYYRLSPPLADHVRQHNWLRAITRIVISPLAWLAERVLPKAEAGAFFRPTNETAESGRQWLIQVKPDTDANAVKSMADSVQGQIIQTLRGHWVVIEIGSSMDIPSALALLRAHPSVQQIEPNATVSRPRAL